jgi:hypothetical protein
MVFTDSNKDLDLRPVLRIDTRVFIAILNSERKIRQTRSCSDGVNPAPRSGMSKEDIMARETIADDRKTGPPLETSAAASLSDREEARETQGPYRGIGPRGYTRSDTAIQEDVSQRLTENSNIDASDIEVDVVAGEVVLTGSVRTDDERRSAERAVLLVLGVRSVANRLQLTGERTAGESAMAAQPQRAEPTEAERRLEKAAWLERAQEVGSANIAVLGIYRHAAAVKDAIDALKTAGFRDTDVALLLPQNTGTKDLAFTKSTKAPQGAAVGALLGAAVGGVFAWLVAAGLLAMPGISPLVAAVPIITVLAGIGIGVVGGIIGALIGWGTPEYTAKRYDGRVKGGQVLLSVHADDRTWASRAEKVLERTAGEHISRRKEKSAEFAVTNRPLRKGEEYRED